MFSDEMDPRNIEESLGDSDKDEEEWIDLLGSGELFRKIIQKGDTDSQRPQNDSVVSVRIKGTLENDEKEIESNDRLSFQLGHCEVIQALELCVQAMYIGEIDLIKTTSRFAYGDSGHENIPPGASLLYEVELLGWEEAPDLYSMDQSTRLDICDKKKCRGNHLFQKKNYDQAIRVYGKAISILDIDLDNDNESAPKENIARIHKLSADIYNNMGAAQLKLESWSDALISFGKCLERDPNNVKAHFRRGKANVGLGDFETAVVALKRAVQLDPSAVLAHKELSRVQAIVSKNKKAEKRMYSKMFRNTGDSLQSKKSSWGISNKMVAVSVISAGLAFAAGAFYKFKFV